MVTITVGYIAGFIAAAIFVTRIWAPMVMTFILSGVLRDRNSAATWSVAARSLERTHWPDILRSDSVKTHGARKTVVLLTTLITAMTILIAVAGIVTPLGIYQTLALSENVQTPFKYLLDTSPFGVGTPPRSNFSFNRICATGDLLVSMPIPCPFSDTIAITSTDGNWINASYPYGYDISIPKTTLDIYSSGVGNNTTISNYFDIQWRQYMITSDPKKILNNGSLYLVEAFRGMQSLGLNNAIEPVEGLIVDTVNGGIGFRNHTVPPGFQLGVTWEEDLLFIEPETVCVDTNTTLDYTIAAGINSTIPIIDLVLTDRGGFVNINKTFPVANLTNPQENQDLWTRAYKAAWMTNAYTMVWYNVTNPHNDATGQSAFAYRDTFLGKEFPVVESSTEGLYTSFGMDATFNQHLNFESDGAGNSSNPAAGGLPNPFKISNTNFTDIGMLCAGAGDGDYANITNIYVHCALMRGIPQRKDDGPGILFEPGSRWSQPLYTCASSVKATIKTVSFLFNGTHELSNLKVSNVQPKNYSDPNSLPLWGVENTKNEYLLGGLSMIWGLVSPKYENHPNVSTVRQESLYLTGYFNEIGDTGFTSAPGWENLPASDFYHLAMESAYTVNSNAGSALDYTGLNNMAVWARWQKLSNSTATAALIPNLIFTDYAAAAVVGTKGVLGPGNAAAQNLVPLTVTPTISVIRYHWPFAIPAFLVIAAVLFFTAVAAIVMLCRRHNIGRLRMHLNQLAPGRIFTTFLSPEPGAMSLSAEAWNRAMGKLVIDLSDEHPFGAGKSDMPEKSTAVTGYGAVPDAPDDDGVEFLGANRHSRERSDGDIGKQRFFKAPPSVAGR